MTDEEQKQEGKQTMGVIEYNADKSDVKRFEKAFVGVAANPGTTYNIQNALHAQGYFGVKITLIGSNLSLLEGQEDGEVEALMEDANEWLEEWFKEICRWNPKDVELERIIWLRIFGIPVHAWNDDFFFRVSKPWGVFLKADDVTSKKLTMDVARVLIRTSCQKAVDEFLDVKINCEFFHLHIVEDSYGPMRIMVPQTQALDGRSIGSENSEVEEEEAQIRLMAVDDEAVRESEGDGEN
jgi:hypothetical protein